MSQETVNLTPVLNLVRQVQSTLSSQIDDVSADVGVVRRDLQLTGDELRELRAEFVAFVDQAARTAAIQRAETRVGNLKAQLDREFGHYSVVRRTSVGILQAFDVGIVSNDSVTSVSEELMLQSPRYWLAPALVALAAWSRDNPDIAEKAVREAFARDRNKTSLLFGLVLRRQGRLDGSVRWLRHYFASLDPAALTREFAVILEAASYDAFGPAGQQLVTDRLASWRRQLRAGGDLEEAQIRKWVGEIGIQRQRVDTTQYAELAQLAVQWPDLVRQIESASALPEMITKYQAVKTHQAPLPTHLEDMLDDILDQLVTEYDKEELPLKREVVFNEAVIAEDGDVDRARRRADELNQALEETNDVVTLQTLAAISPDQLGVSVHTQRIAIGVGVGDLRSAVGRYCAAYRLGAVDAVTFDFSDKHSNYASMYRFPGCRITSDTPESDAIKQLTTIWRRAFDDAIARARFKNSWYYGPAAITVVVAVIAFLISPIIAVLGLLAGGGVVYWMGQNRKRGCDAEVLRLESARQSAVAHSVALYRDAAAQLIDARLVYSELDGHESELLRLVDSWPTAERKEEVAV